MRTARVFEGVEASYDDRVEALPDGEPVSVVEARRLRQALIARYGVDLGGEAFSAAVTWAYEHRERLSTVGNRVGYLFRVGMSATRAQVRWQRRTTHRDVERLAEAQFPDVDLYRALQRLPTRQRVAVVLVHAHGWPYAEVAEILDVTVTAVTNHVHRGLGRLRKELESGES